MMFLNNNSKCLIAPQTIGSIDKGFGIVNHEDIADESIEGFIGVEDETNVLIENNIKASGNYAFDEFDDEMGKKILITRLS